MKHRCNFGETLIISMETLKIIIDQEAHYFKTSMFFNGPCIIDVLFSNLAEVFRYMRRNCRGLE